MDGAAEQQATGPAADAPGIVAPADPWRAFLTPADSAEFLAGWLAVAGPRLPDAVAAVLFLRGDGGRLGVAARWAAPAPQGQPLPDDKEIAALAEVVLKKPEPLLSREGGHARLGWPLDAGGELQGVLVLVLSRAPDGARFRLLMRELHWAGGHLEARLWQGQAALGRRQADSARLMAALLAATDEHRRFDGAALALVNAVPELTGFQRAALGMLRGNRIRLEALSRQAAFTRRSERVRAWQAAMDEALAQADMVVWPERPDRRRMIVQAHGALAVQTGAGLLVSAPLIVRGQVVGVLTLEHARQEGGLVLSPGTLDDLRLAAAAIAPLLQAKYDQRRLLTGRLPDLVQRGTSAIFGRRPVYTLGALALVLALGLPWLIPATMNVRADATVEGAVQQAAIAPGEGFIAEAPVRAGQEVAAGTLLARLDDRDLRLEAAAASARQAQARQTLREALAGGDRAAGAVASADLDEATAALDLIRARLQRLEIRAPMAGLVVSGDLSQRIGSPVRQGEVLFEIAELSGWRLRIEVSEYDLALVAPGQSGTAVLAGLSGLALPFQVTGIAAVSDPGGGENRFRVEAAITTPPPALRPGLTGTAKIAVGDSNLGWTWLRGSLVRLRLLLWQFLP